MANILIIIAACVWLILGIIIIWRFLYWDRRFKDVYEVSWEMATNGDCVPYNRVKEPKK